MLTMIGHFFMIVFLISILPVHLDHTATLYRLGIDATNFKARHTISSRFGYYEIHRVTITSLKNKIIFHPFYLMHDLLISLHSFFQVL